MTVTAGKQLGLGVWGPSRSGVGEHAIEIHIAAVCREDFGRSCWLTFEVLFLASASASLCSLGW